MKTDSAKYGKRWQIERKRVQREIAAGRGVCELCGWPIASGDHCVFKTVNGGRTWRTFDIGDGNTVWALAIGAQNPAIVYAGTSDGVRKSTNAGLGWRSAASPQAQADDRNMNAVVVDPRTSATVYVAGSGGIFTSTDGGRRWRVSEGLPAYAIAIDPKRPATVYAGGEDGILQSADGGRHWLPGTYGTDRGGAPRALAVDPAKTANIYAGASGLFKSADGGGSWQAGGLANRFVRAIATDPKRPTSIYAGTRGHGIFKSTDGAHTWRAVSK